MLLDVGIVDINVAGPNHQAPALRHRVARVYGQVHDDLVDHADVRIYRRNVVREIRFQCDVVAQQSVQKPGEIRQHCIEIDDAALHHLFAAEHEQLPREARTAFRRRRNQPEWFSHLAIAVILPKQPIGVPLDNRENIIEIMRYAGSQLPNRFQFLRVP